MLLHDGFDEMSRHGLLNLAAANGLLRLGVTSPRLAPTSIAAPGPLSNILHSTYAHNLFNSRRMLAAAAIYVKHGAGPPLSKTAALQGAPLSLQHSQALAASTEH